MKTTYVDRENTKCKIYREAAERAQEGNKKIKGVVSFKVAYKVAKKRTLAKISANPQSEQFKVIASPYT